MQYLPLIVTLTFLVGCGGPPEPGCSDDDHEGLLCLIEPNTPGVCKAGACVPMPCASDGECYADTDNCQMGVCVAGVCGAAPMPDGTACHTPAHAPGTCGGGSCEAL